MKVSFFCHSTPFLAFAVSHTRNRTNKPKTHDAISNNPKSFSTANNPKSPQQPVSKRRLQGHHRQTVQPFNRLHDYGFSNESAEFISVS